MSKPLVNRVANSSLVTLKLEEFYPKADFMCFDIKDYLFKGLILREREFRSALKTHDWPTYHDKPVLITCSADAIIPVWAYMLIECYLHGVASEIFTGTEEEFIAYKMTDNLSALDLNAFKDQRIVIKGCSDKNVPPSVYAYATRVLLPHAQSIMYGEPCSTVPIYKKSKKNG